MTSHKLEVVMDCGTTKPTLKFVSSHTPKRRSSAACLECRRRKVRCDILAIKAKTCTNCRLDGIQCEMVESRRRRRGQVKSPSATVQSYPTPGSEVSPCNATSTTSPVARRASIVSSRSDNVTSAIHAGLSPDMDMTSFLRTGEPILEESDGTSDGTPGGLPNFIQQLPKDLTVEESQYLAAKQCFTFPPAPFQREVLLKFLEFGYPFLPIVNPDQISAVALGHPRRPIPLLLYHALMGAGLAAVDLHTLNKYGYASKCEARLAFYCKAKALIDMDVEVDRVCICQAALLFVSWTSKNDRKDGYYWSGLALGHAYSLNLHKFAVGIPSTNAERLRRRLWWTTVFKEADVCLAMGKPPRLMTHDIPELTFNDFSAVAVSPSDYLDGVASTSSELIQMAVIQRAKLSLIVHEILRFMHASPGHGRSANSRDQKVWQLDAELQDWRHQLPIKMWWNQGLEVSLDPEVQLTISFLNLSYLMAMIMLHKPEIPARRWTEPIIAEGRWGADDELCKHQLHARSMRRAADDMTTIHRRLSELELTPVIPALGMATICAAVSVHLLDARSTCEVTRSKSLAQLDTCLTVLQEVGNLHYTAAEVARLVDASIKSVKKSGVEGIDRGLMNLAEGPLDESREVPQTVHNMFSSPVESRGDLIPSVGTMDNIEILNAFPEMEYFFDFGMDL